MFEEYIFIVDQQNLFWNSERATMQKDPQHAGRNKRRRNNNDPEVKTSKALSWALRHAAPTLGLDMGSDGYVPLAQLLSHSHAKFRGMTNESVQRVVASNDKQRFSLAQRNGEWFIRANQGHSITTIDPHKLLTPIDPSELSTIVHGTYMDPWMKSIQTQGLAKMSRTHIHFAKGMPSEEGVMSGMRKTCGVYIYIDGTKCASDNIEFLESTNGVILTAGVEGVLPTRYFSHVLTRSGEVLLDQRNAASAERPTSIDTMPSTEQVIP